MNKNKWDFDEFFKTLENAEGALQIPQNARQLLLNKLRKGREPRIPEEKMTEGIEGARRT